LRGKAARNRMLCRFPLICRVNILPELIIFDCDGVLVDSEPLSAQATALALAEFGVAMTMQEALDAFTGLTLAEAIDIVQRRYGVALPAAYALRKEELTAQEFRSRLQPMEGAVQALSRLAIPCCVGSNSPHRRLAMTFECTGLARFFKGRIYSAEDVARGKPEPDLFLHAARQHGIPPGHCLVIDDSPTGVRAAIAAGMPVIGFIGGSHSGPHLRARLLEAGAHWIIDDFSDLIDHIQTIQDSEYPS
jgi:HAD superfamily hydrolase (TIGR01509 family)